MKKISVIVPVYNAESFLEKCVDSLLTQTYKNLEIILVDDGSADRSGEICEEYAKKDERVVVIRKKNGGVSSARNAGLKAAGGELITFIDPDDWLDSDCYKETTDVLSKTGADIVIFGFKEVFNREYVPNFSPCEHKPTCCFTRDDVLGIMLGIMNNDEDCRSIKGFSGNRLYRRKILDDVHFYEDLSYCEDVCFNLHAFYNAEKIVQIKKEYYYYYQHNLSYTNKYHDDFAETLRRLTKYIEDFFSSRNIIPPKEKMETIYRSYSIGCVKNYLGNCNYSEYKSRRIILNDFFKADKLRKSLHILGSTKKQAVLILMIRFKLYLLVWVFYNKVNKKR